MLATILTILAELFKDLPMISGWFKTTQAETQNTTAQQEQTEAELLAKEGRPKW
jgi:hypothetical protein